MSTHAYPGGQKGGSGSPPPARTGLMSTHAYPGGQNGGSGSPPPARTGVEPQAISNSVATKMRTKVFFIGFLLRVSCAALRLGAGSGEQKDIPFGGFKRYGFNKAGYREQGTGYSRSSENRLPVTGCRLQQMAI